MKTFSCLIVAATVLSLVVMLPGCKSEEISKPPQKENQDKPDTPDTPDTPTPDNPDIPDNPPGVDEFTNYLAPHYIVSFIRDPEITATADDSSVDIYFSRGKKSTAYTWWYAAENINPEKAAIYTQLCEHYGDTGYDKERKYFEVYSGGYDFMADNIVSIDIFSGTDYDQQHPAGTSLKDICILRSASPQRFITSGYTKPYDWTVIPEYFDEKSAERFGGERAGNYPIAKLLADCTAEDFILLGSGYELYCELVFTHKPASGLGQRFLITLTDERGMTYTAATNQTE